MALDDDNDICYANILYPDQSLQNAGPELDPNCIQKVID